MHDEPLPSPIEADRRRLVRAAARLLGAAEAEDAVQDAYVRAMERQPGTIAVVPAWLLTVTRHAAIDRLRAHARHHDALQRWPADLPGGGREAASPSAEHEAARVQEAAGALRLLAATLSPADAAAVLLHEVFDVEHAEIARARGTSDASARQQLRRALLRLRRAAGAASAPAARAAPAEDDAVFLAALQAVRQRDPQALWAMLRQPPVRAMGAAAAQVPPARTATPARAACRLLQVGGQLGLVLTLDGVTLCVLPLGVHGARHQDAPDAVPA